MYKTIVLRSGWKWYLGLLYSLFTTY